MVEAGDGRGVGMGWEERRGEGRRMDVFRKCVCECEIVGRGAKADVGGVEVGGHKVGMNN